MCWRGHTVPGLRITEGPRKMSCTSCGQPARRDAGVGVALKKEIGLVSACGIIIGKCVCVSKIISFHMFVIAGTRDNLIWNKRSQTNTRRILLLLIAFIANINHCGFFFSISIDSVTCKEFDRSLQNIYHFSKRKKK